METPRARGGTATRAAVAVALVAGMCGCAPRHAATARPEEKPREAVIARPKPIPPPVASAPDWEAFSRTRAALRRDISRRADDLGKGPVGDKARQLASLRLSSSGRDLIDAGSLDGAVEALQRAISLFGGNGYAYLWLAYVHHLHGRDDLAAEFAASARRYLPDDTSVRAELEGLVLSIGQGSPRAAS